MMGILNKLTKVFAEINVCIKDENCYNRKPVLNVKLKGILMNGRYFVIQFGIFVIFISQLCFSQSVVIRRDPESAMACFAAEEIASALSYVDIQSKQVSLNKDIAEKVDRKIVLQDQYNRELADQGFSIYRENQNTIIIKGGDERGVMYGGLEVAEMLRLGKGLDAVKEKVKKPSIEKRGIKFNIPLDARTPSYDDTGDAAQNNYIEMWNYEFWRAFLDDLARYRYNTLTLWNPHPFPSMIKLDDYPDVALDDVCVCTEKLKNKTGSWGEPQSVTSKVLNNLRVVKKMTMDEKIAFWRKVMRYAKDRGIDIYFITWNVYANSVASGGKYMWQGPPLYYDPNDKGKYGITNDQDNPETIKYLRACVSKFILTYPDLTGIGVTAGENMKNRKDEFSPEKWLWETYGKGIMDAKKVQPDREVKFIHRVWMGGLDGIMRDFASKYPDNLDISFKYARARLYSSTQPIFVRKLLQQMKKYDGLKCWWNLRNDDIFTFRWGDPEYVREFLKNFPEEITAGYHMGSDGYVWGRESISLNPASPRQLEIQKHWYKFMLWGRLGYDLDMSPEYFQKMLKYRFPETDETLLCETWATASKIIPLVNRFYWRDWDYMWAVESCQGNRIGFQTVMKFTDNPAMPGCDIYNISDYVKGKLKGVSLSKKTPEQVAEALNRYAEMTLENVEKMRKETEHMSRELKETLFDIQAMSYLGQYYAAKISGALDLKFYIETKDNKYGESSIRHLEDALTYWKKYAQTATKLYHPTMLARTRMLDWNRLAGNVQNDIEIVKDLIDPDFKSLFNGKSLDGWTVKCTPKNKDKTFWTVSGGAIVGNSAGDKDHDYIWLVTENEYDDFELRLEFRVYQRVLGNSGVQIRSRYDDQEHWLNGPQVDICPTQPWRTGMMWDETRGNQRWIYPDLPRGKWVDESMASEDHIFMFNFQEKSWNDMKITAAGNHITVKLNGHTITDYDGGGVLDDNLHRKRNVGQHGHIALQIHKNDEVKILFRNIYIKEL